MENFESGKLNFKVFMTGLEMSALHCGYRYGRCESLIMCTIYTDIPLRCLGTLTV